jgi:antitoxin component YwqK of YwqJK toxin-antitoxin module
VKCKDGKYEGMVHEWHENGAEKTKGQYRSGKLVGTHRVFYDNGSLAKANHYDESGNRDGDALSYYDDGTKQSEGVWVNGKQNGLFKYYYDSEYKGRLQQDDFYNDGQLQLRIGYYSNPNMGNGGIRATTNYVTTDYKIWNPIGELSHHSNKRGIIYQQ